MARIRVKNVETALHTLIDGAVSDRLKQVKGPFEAKLKSFFNGSRPGYPGKLLGWAQRSVYVRQRGKYLLEYGARGPHSARRSV